MFNCAAFHNVDVCEREEDRSFEVNARAVKRIAELCAGAGTRLVHLSTNYVFSGDGDQPNTEADLPRPGSVYAISKLAGEHTALAYTDALVVRTSGLYGSGGNESKGGNFVQRMVARADAQGALEVVADQRLTPTYTVDLAEALIAAVDRGLGGLLHLTNSGACSWHEFTLAIMEIAGIGVPVKPTETLRAPGGVDRPLNGVLSCANAAQAGVPLPPRLEDGAGGVYEQRGPRRRAGRRTRASGVKQESEPAERSSGMSSSANGQANAIGSGPVALHKQLGRTNGLAPNPPQKGQTVLITGGGGYIGCVLTGRLLDRGYNVRILDRLYWGEQPLESFAGRIELLLGDVRDIPDEALDDVDGVIHLAGLSNDPTAEYDPEANWQMNAVATESLGRACVERGIERVVFASSCSLYDGLPPGTHDEGAAVRPSGAYATSKAYGEQALLGLIDDGLCPVILRNGTVYGFSPRTSL